MNNFKFKSFVSFISILILCISIPFKTKAKKNDFVSRWTLIVNYEKRHNSEKQLEFFNSALTKNYSSLSEKQIAQMPKKVQKAISDHEAEMALKTFEKNSKALSEKKEVHHLKTEESIIKLQEIDVSCVVKVSSETFDFPFGNCIDNKSGLKIDISAGTNDCIPDTTSEGTSSVKTVHNYLTKEIANYEHFYHLILICKN